MREASETGARPTVMSIQVPTHGRFLVRPALVPGPAPLLVGFHGYGESAERHLEELVTLADSDRWLVVSVHALHRFYERRTGTVVGSWMTSQDRELMIADNVRYVDAVVDHLRERHTTTDTLVFSGFSQGVAMAYRAGTRGRHGAAAIIALAGDVPPELREDRTLRWPRVLIGRGDADTYYTAEKMREDLDTLTQMEAPHASLTFDGGHVWHDAFRSAAGRLLGEVRGNG